VTCTEIVELTLPFAARVTEAGLGVHVTPEGAPLQASVTCPPKPPVAFTVSAKLDDPPAAMVADAGASEPVSPPTIICMSSICVIFPLAAPLAAVTSNV
jgi:hypothetical protein